MRGAFTVRGAFPGLLLASCLVATVAVAENPPAIGFNLAGSDPRAIEIADATMAAMGGRAAWDAVSCLRWTIFNRSHTWDRRTHLYRLEDGDLTVVLNLTDKNGTAARAGVLLSGDALTEALTRAYSIWINDSYWLVMPYKLKDSGVTLKFLGQRNDETGRLTDVLQLTFEGVGETPENRYEVFVDAETRRVCQWSFYRSATDTEPRFTLPWSNWHPYGDIWLSTGRGRGEVTGVEAGACAPELFDGARRVPE